MRRHHKCGLFNFFQSLDRTNLGPIFSQFGSWRITISSLLANVFRVALFLYTTPITRLLATDGKRLGVDSDPKIGSSRNLVAEMEIPVF